MGSPMGKQPSLTARLNTDHPQYDVLKRMYGPPEELRVGQALYEHFAALPLDGLREFFSFVAEYKRK